MEVKEKENLIVTEAQIEQTEEKIEKNNEFHIIDDYHSSLSLFDRLKSH